MSDYLRVWRSPGASKVSCEADGSGVPVRFHLGELDSETSVVENCDTLTAHLKAQTGSAVYCPLEAARECLGWELEDE